MLIADLIGKAWKSCLLYFGRRYTYVIVVVVVVVVVLVVVAMADIVGMVQFHSPDCTPGVVVENIAENYHNFATAAAAAGSASAIPRCCSPVGSTKSAVVHNVASEWFV